MQSKLKYRKEGFAAQSVGAIVTLIVGVGVSVLVLIFVGTLGGQTYNVAEDDILTIGNHALGSNVTFANLSNESASSFGYSPIHSGTLIVHNNSHIINNANFTVDYTAGTILWNNNYSGMAGLEVNATFTWGDNTTQTNIKNSILSSFSALEQTGDYLPLIVLAVVITLVMALVLGLGNMGGGARGGSAL